MTVEPAAFVAAMRRHWEGPLRNTASPRLEAVWYLMAKTFNAQIAHHGVPSETPWKVFKPETGTGKSQGLAVYCSMLPAVDHPGVLVVTRMKVQADDLAATINGLAGSDVALAYHTDNRVPVETLAHHPVLIITHKAYELGLDAVNRGQPEASAWEQFHKWSLTGRKLVVIDEALDIVEEAKVDVGALNYAIGAIRATLPDQFKPQVGALEAVKNVLDRLRREATEPNGGAERIVWQDDGMAPASRDMTALRRALRGQRFDHLMLRKNDAKENRAIIDNIDKTVKDAQAVLERWTWYAKVQGVDTMNSARLVVPENLTSAVILDATATANRAYDVFPKVEILGTARSRDYSTVTLHVSRGHSVGKVSMVKNARQAAEKLVQNLVEVLPPDRRVLVITHKPVESAVISYKGAHFAAFDVAHWGALDGRNDWADYDTVVVFGLPYRESTWAVNTFMAYQGLQSTDWLRGDASRTFANYRDIRHALNIGQMVVSVVQGINRVRCRRVIDAEGRCLPTDVFVLLPSGRDGEELQQGIVTEMPAINVVEWDYRDLKRTVKRTDYEESLARFATNIRRGYVSASAVRDELRIPLRSWRRLTAQLSDPDSALSKRLAGAGVVYRVERRGKTYAASLCRAVG